MKIRVLKEFEDLQEKVIRKPGNVFECTKERAREIRTKLSGHCPACKWIEEVEEPKGKEKEEG